MTTAICIGMGRADTRGESRVGVEIEDSTCYLRDTRRLL